MNAWLPQASYPCGNFSDTSCLTSRARAPGGTRRHRHSKDKRIDRPRFHGLYSYWKSKSK